MMSDPLVDFIIVFCVAAAALYIVLRLRGEID